MKDSNLNYRSGVPAWILQVFAFIILSALLIAGLQLGTSYGCNNGNMLLRQAQQVNDRIIANGKIIQTSKLSDTAIQSLASQNGGKDLSDNFPAFTLLGRLPESNTYTDPDIQECVGGSQPVADEWLRRKLEDSKFRVAGSGLLQNCPLPNGSSGPCFFSAAARHAVSMATVGRVVITSDILAQKSNGSGGKETSYIVLNGYVYNVAPYLQIALQDGNSFNESTGFFGQQVTQLLQSNIGQDASAQFNSVPKADQIQRCMSKLFLAGVTQNTSLMSSCALINPVLYGFAGLILLFSLPKLIVGLCCFPSRSRGLAKSSVVVLMHCYGQSTEQLQKSLSSIAQQQSAGGQRCFLFAISDGNPNTEDNLLDALGYDGPDGQVKEYTSLGNGSTRLNAGLVFTGVYNSSGVKLPYCVVTKVGNRSEQYKPGHRGKLDSTVLLLSLLNKLSNAGTSKLSTLEFEIFEQIDSKLNIDLLQLSCMLSLDAGCVLGQSAISDLAHVLETDRHLLSVSPMVKPEASLSSFGQALSTFASLDEHHINRLLRSYLGVLCIQSDKAVMYKLKNSDGSPCLLHQRVLSMVSNGYQDLSSFDKRVRHWKGEEQALVAASMKQFSQMRHRYDPSIKVVDSGKLSSIAVIRAYASQWKVQFHQKWSLLSSSMDKNASFGVRLWAFFDAISMLLLPAATAYCYYLLAQFFFQPQYFSNVISVGCIALVSILLMIIMILRGNFVDGLVVPLHLTIGFPLFGILIPLVSIFSGTDIRVIDCNSSNGWKCAVGRHGCAMEDSPDSQQYINRRAEAKTLQQWQSFVLSEPQQYLARKVASRKQSNVNQSGQDQVAVQMHAQDLESFNGAPQQDYRISNNYTMSSASDFGKLLPTPPEAINRDSMFTVKSAPRKRSDASHNQGPESPALLKPTNFREDRTPIIPKSHFTPTSPGVSNQSRATSMARSDYSSKYAPSSNGRFSKYTMSSRPTTAAMSVYSDETLKMMSGIGKEDLKEEIKLLLHEADLNTVTRREIKDHLVAEFGDAVDFYNDYVDECIEEITLEKLALI
ncbi:hypothetical protein MP228_013031 [Amoeboaphelidium protococcarum]|nr:hypothetical protein MP228_013031 [Amoeboaphelidium protococcarum]